jgi:hypothetical protein
MLKFAAVIKNLSAVLSRLLRIHCLIAEIALNGKDDIENCNSSNANN